MSPGFSSVTSQRNFSQSGQRASHHGGHRTKFLRRPATRKWAASTFNHPRSLLMLVYRESQRAGKVSVDPARDVRHRRENNSRVRYLNHMNLCTQMSISETPQGGGSQAACRHRTRLLEHMPDFELGRATGLRKGNLYGLMWTMLDWSGRMLNVPTSKNGTALHIRLTARPSLRAGLSIAWRRLALCSSRKKRVSRWPTRVTGSRRR